MSKNPDSEELRAKYSEIAALKKAIEEKKREKQNFNTFPLGGHQYVQSTSGYRGRNRGFYKGNIYKRRFHIMNHHPASSGFRRSMSLVFNKSAGDTSGSSEADQSDTSYVTTVTKNGMKLMNSDIYQSEKDRILLQTKKTNELKEKLQRRKRLNLLRKMLSKNLSVTDSCDRILLDNVKYAVVNRGDELIPLTDFMGKGDEYKWNSKMYIRKPNGSLKCVEPIRERKGIHDQCRYFTRHALGCAGLCQKGSQCRYKHDENHISLCRQYMANNCRNRNCLLSHQPNQFNAPLCRYNLQGSCSNPKCPYIHLIPDKYGDDSYNIWVCRPFAIDGSCPRGRNCPFLHLFICPDFEESGQCPRGKACTLAHPVTRETKSNLQQLFDLNQTDQEQPVLVESSSDKNIISSYTVDPEDLFKLPSDGKYDFYIDNTSSVTQKDTSVANELNSDFMIQLDSESEFESELEDVAESEVAEFANKDFVEV